jgi:hypothetical protein
VTDYPVSVAARVAWQRFHGCDPEYIAIVCHSRCCDAPSRPGGTMITIHRSERAAIEARGGRVTNGLLVTAGRCTFKDPAGLCRLHDTPDKPFGCIASPWTLSSTGRALIVRNRYRMLVCYAATTRRRGRSTAGFLPAYVAFRASLDIILGEDRATDLCERLDRYGDACASGYRGPERYRVVVPARQWRILRENDETKHGAR